jgi:ATP-dependent Clp endopeptidase proteolytic subunit ClpP
VSEVREPTKAEVDASVAKNKAEATKLIAEADAITAKAEADVAKAAAEADKATAEARKETALALGLEANLVKARNDAAREDEKRQEELAEDRFHHTYLFDTDVNAGSVKKCIRQLSTWERTTPTSMTVELVINSPGGDVVEGFALIDFITHLVQGGHTVNTTAYGMAASMGGVLLEAGQTRRMGANAVLLIHEAQFGAIGSYGEVEDRVKLVNIFHDRILDLFAERATVSRSFIKRNWNRRDWWLSAQTALKHGFVDELC